ncbi:multiple coagulation factor deficiency protein 2 homolog isoform X3 [Dendroctonus ponderosae]|uniref:EF-hand domain-containing protein n=1 Tax=Dendroctonus ponderosae TaxID=77166 RepID=A0AAR5Q4I0_DENPD|nr:multiple coagulation factor deficiency protein 2 homolog isoform X3 [Dendroctonus ponderosae]XP_048520442.1 multiple coagulation factor deficiency protein 2 homolog isoform X3 [Dendroctonus ponderosae]XP_048524610.1 multiple coagulation factor deficiency protein 2 homolog isoform X3 [Dendroctonus ponderosae]
MFQFIVLLLAVIVFLYVDSQRPPPGVNPQHYQQQQYQHQPQYQVPQQHQYQQQNVPVQQPPVQQAPIQQQYQQPAGHGHGHDHGHQRQVFNADNIAHEKEHIQEHMEVPIDTSKMSDQELQFHYFKMHDSDNNNKLDGCELIKSLIHWHEQGSKEKQGEIEEKIFKDEELVNLIDPILNVDDTNRDGFIDYPEFIKAQQKAAGQKQDKPQH